MNRRITLQAAIPISLGDIGFNREGRPHCATLATSPHDRSCSCALLSSGRRAGQADVLNLGDDRRIGGQTPRHCERARSSQHRGLDAGRSLSSVSPRMRAVADNRSSSPPLEDRAKGRALRTAGVVVARDRFFPFPENRRIDFSNPGKASSSSGRSDTKQRVPSPRLVMTPASRSTFM